MQSICLHEDDRYRITLFRGTGDGSRLAVSFDHGRGRMQGFEPAEYPNFALRLGIDALRVQTACRDWFVSDRSVALAEALDRATRDRADVICSGFSMGGYAALLYSAACHAKRVMVVSPQYSIDPAIAPFDTARHEKFARIGMAMPLPEAQGNTGVGGVLLYDPVIAADRAHMRLIARAFPRLRIIALPHGGHPATSAITGPGASVGRIAAMVVGNRINATAIRQMHRKNRRASENYWLSLASAGLRRHPQRALPELLRLAREAGPQTRFEAALLLVEQNHPEAPDLMVRLLDALPGASPAWGRRLEQAMRAAEAAHKDERT
ncbi:MAG: hypothetical protein U1E41_13910 [Paracoccus sp. (in: a-proteobacteria)]|jgi:hypothetical protein